MGGLGFSRGLRVLQGFGGLGFRVPHPPLGGLLGVCGLAFLGGSWAVINGVIGPLIWVISIVTLLITLLIATHEAPSRVFGFGH